MAGAKFRSCHACRRLVMVLMREARLSFSPLLFPAVTDRGSVPGIKYRCLTYVGEAAVLFVQPYVTAVPKLTGVICWHERPVALAEARKRVLRQQDSGYSLSCGIKPSFS